MNHINVTRRALRYRSSQDGFCCRSILLYPIMNGFVSRRSLILESILTPVQRRLEWRVRSKSWSKTSNKFDVLERCSERRREGAIQREFNCPCVEIACNTKNITCTPFLSPDPRMNMPDIDPCAIKGLWFERYVG